jgi:hypothetical protein
MAKQHSDNIEDRFREAAENISFPPNEEAWDKMEALLDKDKRRRPVFAWWFLLLFGLLVGAGVIGYRQFTSGTDSPVTSDSSSSPTGHREVVRNGNNSSAGPEVGRNAQDDNLEFPPVSSEIDRASLTQQKQGFDAKEEKEAGSVYGTINPITSRAQRQSEKLPIAVKSSSKMTGSGNVASPVFLQKNLRRGDDITAKRNDLTSRRLTGTRKDFSDNDRAQSGSEKRQLFPARRGDDNSAAISAKTNDERDSITNTNSKSIGDSLQKASGRNLSFNNTGSSASKVQSGDSASGKSQIAKVDSTTKMSTPIKINASSKKWLLDKGFNLSLGARIDATDLHRISLHQFNQLATASIGYRFSNRLSLQAGVVIQKAIYYAGPDDYYVKPGSYLSMYRISKIDAVCQIYEIPLSVRYDAIIGKGLRVYATGGLSSFYMKKENYRYHATGSSGYRMFDSTYRQNKNYFSSAYLGAGVEKRITPVFSVLAEPYAKLPVAGVGAGKVKLYSGGIQLMLRYQPQSNKKTSPKK